MNFIVDNWFLIFIGICVLGVAVIFIKDFLTSPTDNKIKIIKEFIYTLILDAEKELGSSSGQAKFAKVIQMFYSTCPVDLRNLISEEMVIKFIEEGVARMKEYFDSNPQAKENILKGSDIK